MLFGRDVMYANTDNIKLCQKSYSEISTLIIFLSALFFYVTFFLIRDVDKINLRIRIVKAERKKS